MRQELLARGIPADKIYADFAGFRTLDSVLRARDIFGLSTFILISQKFHNERAVYIARSNGIEAVGYNAADVNPASPLKTTLREIFARDKVFFDRWLGVGPKFGGETVEIP
jgi:SanA protein